MDIGGQVLVYVAVAVLAMAISFGVLAVTRIPGVVVLSSAVLTTLLYVAYARINGTGHWDTIAIIALFTILVFSSLVSFVFLGIGRLLGWSTFLEEQSR